MSRPMDKKKVKLIELVKKHEELYDSTNKYYNEKHRRDSIWRDIALELGKSVSVCKTQWAALRDYYRKFLRSFNSNESENEWKIWQYYKEMEFLRPYLSATKKDLNEFQSKYGYQECNIMNNTTNNDISGVYNYTILPAILPPSVPKFVNIESCAKESRNKLPMAVVYGDNFRERNENIVVTPDSQNMPPDPMAKFFECMSDTVKTLHPELQIDVKSKIFKTVIDAEKTNFSFKNSFDL